MSSRHLVGRRQFLIASSTAFAAAATLGPQVLAASAAPKPTRLAVGFAHTDRPSEVIAATSIFATDGGFIGSDARVTVSGASGTAKDSHSRRVVDLQVHHSYFDGARQRVAPFIAWGSSRMTGDQGQSVSFTVPIADTQSLIMTVSAEAGPAPGSATSRRRAVGAAGGATSAATSLPLVFGLSHDAPLKLTRGFFVVVPLFAEEAEPNWSEYRLERVRGRWALVGWNEVASFEHLVLQIDHANRD